MLTSVMRRTRAAALVAVALGVSPAIAAEPDLAAFNAFGGKPGLDRVADLGVERVLKDPRISQYFAHANIPLLKEQLGVQFCMLLNGPCHYAGPDMKSAHGGMHIHEAQFNALAEDFQLAMDDLDVPFRWQNSLLAKLAPMARDIDQP